MFTTHFIEQLVHHLPALLIVLPLMAAPVCVIIRHKRFSWFLSSLISALTFAASLALLTIVKDGDTVRYALGGWAAPTGIEYYVDISNALILVLISGISTIVSIYSLPTVRKEIPGQKHYLFYAGWLMCLTGLLGITITGDAFNVFVFLEISSLATYLLIALGKERPHSFIASFRYLIMGSVGASFILLGIGFLYAATGTLNMSDIASRIADVSDSRTTVVAFSFILIGLLIKIAVFPVHSWLPNAYQYAPTAVSSFLAGTATKVSLYVLIRFMYQVFGTEYTFNQMMLGHILLPAAVFGFLVMSVVAIFQTDIRRMLAFSSIAQIGYILAGIAMMSVSGLSAAMVHMVNHGLIKSALFMATGCILYRVGSVHAHSLGRLIAKMPLSVSAFAFAGISLIGLPLTAGFISKWQFIKASLDQDWWWLAALILLSSLLAVVYMGKFIQLLCFSDTEPKCTSQKEVKEAPSIMWASTWALLLVTLYLGLNSSVLVDLTQKAAQQMIGGLN